MAEHKSPSVSERKAELEQRILAGSTELGDYADLASAVFAAGEHDQAISLYEQALTLSLSKPQKARVYFEMGYAFLWLEKIEQAKQRAGEAISTLTGVEQSMECRYLNGMAHGLLAQTASEPEAAQREAHEGLNWLTPLLDEHPEFENLASAYIQAAHLNNLLSQPDEAIKLCKRCLNLTLEPSEKIDCLYELIEALRAKEKFEEALTLTEDAVNAVPSANDKLLPTIYSTRGLIYLSLDRIPQARDAFERAVDEIYAQRNVSIGKELLQEVYWNLGEVYYTLKSFDHAISTFQKLLSVYPEDNVMRRNILGRLGQSYYANGNFTKALEYYRKVLESATATDEERTLIHQGVGEVYYECGEYEAAVSAFKQAVSGFVRTGDPNYGDSLLCLGACYAAMTDYKAAYDCYIQLLRSSSTLEKYKSQAQEYLAVLPEPYKITFQ